MGKIVTLLTAMLLVLPLGQYALAQEEASAASLYNDAVAKLKAKEYEAALDLMGQALEIADPESDAQVIKLAKANGARAAYAVGTKNRQGEDYEAALAAYDTGIEYDPGFYANYRGRAQALESSGAVAESVKAYYKASEVAKAAGEADRADSYASKAENIVAVAYGDKAWDDVLAYGNAYLEVAESPDVHYYLSYALKESGNPSSGLEHVDKALEMGGSTDDGKYLYAKGEILEDLGQTDAAVGIYKQITSGKYAERAEYKVNTLSGGR